MSLARALLCCCLAGLSADAGAVTAGSPDSGHPLLDYARSLEATRDPRKNSAPSGASDLRAARHALEQAHPPTDADCARSLGAAVFAGLHADEAQAHEDKGDFGGAATALRHALACSPRDSRLLASLADVLFKDRDIAGSREVIERALVMDPRSVMLTRLAANIDFVEQRWADAVARFRYSAAGEPDRTRAAYWQLMYWLAQMRAGVLKPEFVARRHTEEWPKSLLLYLQDQLNESELVESVQAGDSEYASVTRDERLCEALYYVGEAQWARGHPDLARDYFTAVVNIKMIRFDEHGLALAEIARLRRE